MMVLFCMTFCPCVHMLLLTLTVMMITSCMISCLCVTMPLQTVMRTNHQRISRLLVGPSPLPDLVEWVQGDVTRGPFPFSGYRGFAADIHLPEKTRSIDFVSLFLNDEDYRDILLETNRYASSYLSKEELSSFSRFKSWPKDGITIDDIKAFFALTVAMGVIVQQDLADYWSTDTLLLTPFFGQVMPRDSFLNILSFLHLSDNELYIPKGEVGYDPLKKLGVFYPNILSRFAHVWSPGQNICIDEGLVPYRGKVHFHVYNPGKPNKYGIKTY